MDNLCRTRYSIVESVINLLPRQYAQAVDTTVDLKQRWVAFDALYEMFYEEARRRGYMPEDLDLPEWAQSPESLEQLRRIGFAYELLLLAYGADDPTLPVIEAEKLVPSPPDLETGLPPFTFGDMALIYTFCTLAREEMPDEWGCFFRFREEPLERLRWAFDRLYVVISEAWRTQSLAPLRFNDAQRKKLLILALVSFPEQHGQASQAEIDWLMRVLVDEREGS
ncbi:MAG: hypothetical protein NZ556_00830 [Fimbriimonadales bacterium]|nr:hypothetical protein [Fimbriimonadales bacterium]